jgi:hypothetical protein
MSRLLSTEDIDPHNQTSYWTMHHAGKFLWPPAIRLPELSATNRGIRADKKKCRALLAIT